MACVEKTSEAVVEPDGAYNTYCVAVAGLADKATSLVVSCFETAVVTEVHWVCQFGTPVGGSERSSAIAVLTGRRYV